MTRFHEVMRQLEPQKMGSTHPDYLPDRWMTRWHRCATEDAALQKAADENRFDGKE
ncbi:MAG TPA: hypothetical protein VFG71_03450 [Nitrospiraceae bacterium]|nr:hypothetical protein [Nitrospiraceae bacterium]